MIGFMTTAQNPILPGFFPDPSIIRVEDDFYIVNSSFEYFPAIPIWHSKDLVNWRQIGNAVDRAGQNLDLSDVAPSGGVQAATIRHHNGVFYITSTRVKRQWPGSNYHFVITATDIKGPWSKCHFIEDAYGIDSSLFFDGDKAYFLANRESSNPRFENDAEIWMSEINLDTFELVGEKHTLWNGTGGIFPEGPRMYKRNGFYYLLIAEGGTLHFHTTSIARSEDIFGPYLSSPRNPILTHKHLAREHPVHNVGHADMVELKDGTWWGVALASRPRGGFYDGGNVKWSFGGYYRNLGRETFIFPVTWPADNWSPLFAPETGRVEDSYEIRGLPEFKRSDVPIDFSEESLNTKWVAIRNEERNHFKLTGQNNLTLELQDSFENTFLGTRQTAWNFNCSLTIDIADLKKGDVVGLAAYIKEGAYLSLEIKRTDTFEISVQAASGNQPNASISTDLAKFQIQLSGKDQDYTFSVPDLDFTHTLDGREISCDLTDSHTGVMIAFIGRSEFGSAVQLSDFRS
jgi:alpha-N-arabinofuranosidase